jgi:SAM-dependent methyltransferase
VTGVDRKDKFLNRARQIAKDEKLNVEFIREDMRQFCRPDSYDIILNLFTSFGYFEDETEDIGVIQNISRSLRQDGYLLMESMSREVLARIFVERDWVEIDGKILLEERSVEDNWARIKTRWIIIDENKRMEHTLSLRLYSAPEMQTLLLANGFSSVKFFGNLKGDPYDQNAKRLVLLARK